MPAISAHLNGLEHPARLREVRSLGRRELSRLFDASAGHRPLSLEHLVPKDRGALDEVVHHGKNSLPLFTHFAKVFCRPDDGQGADQQLWGYNRNDWLVQTTVGPGYFVAHPFEVEGEILIDYLLLPPRKPAHWPPIVPNETRLSRFVYSGTQDVLRGVSRHVSIGRATKGGHDMNAWFILCREDAST